MTQTDILTLGLVRAGTQAAGLHFVPEISRYWISLCALLDMVLMGMGFNYYTREENKSEPDANEPTCNSDCRPSFNVNLLSAFLAVVVVVALIVMAFASRVLYRQAKELWSTNRPLFHIVVRTFFMVPNFFYMMRLMYPRIEGWAEWCGIELTDWHYHLARAALPVFVVLAFRLNSWINSKSLAEEAEKHKNEKEKEKEKEVVRTSVVDSGV